MLTTNVHRQHKRASMQLQIKYNSPVILTFTFLSIASYLINSIHTGFQSTDGGLLMPLFSLSSQFNHSSIPSYISLLFYTAGHANFEHLIGNLSFILLIGPLIEERYGAKKLTIMIATTALVTALINITLFNSTLLGASGIVFMLIILTSFTNVKEGQIPLTFILVAVLFIGTEILQSFGNDSVSQFSHILGGLCGSLFALYFAKRVV